MCALLFTSLFSTSWLRPFFSLCAPYSTLPCSWLWPFSISTPMWRLPDMCIPYTYLYNVVGGDCCPHFVFTPRILRVTWVSKPLLTLPLLFITITRHYHYTTLHNLPTLPLLSLQPEQCDAMTHIPTTIPGANPYGRSCRN